MFGKIIKIIKNSIDKISQGLGLDRMLAIKKEEEEKVGDITGGERKLPGQIHDMTIFLI